MAIFHASVKIFTRAKGQSAVAFAAYRAGMRLTDHRTGLVHDYRAKGHVLHTEIMAPANAPAWARDRSALWNAIEVAEKRKDSQVARELELALPRELALADQLDLLRRFIQSQCVDHGMIADVCIHAPDAVDGDTQPHAHVMLTMRSIGPDGFGGKMREWNPEFATNEGKGFVSNVSPLLGFREKWATVVNAAFEAKGIAARVDHRSNVAIGVELFTKIQAMPRLDPATAPPEELLEQYAETEKVFNLLRYQPQRHVSPAAYAAACRGYEVASVAYMHERSAERTLYKAAEAQTAAKVKEAWADRARRGWQALNEALPPAPSVLLKTIIERLAGAMSSPLPEPASLPVYDGKPSAGEIATLHALAAKTSANINQPQHATHMRPEPRRGNTP
jgi:hypothetical protein